MADAAEAPSDRNSVQKIASVIKEVGSKAVKVVGSTTKGVVRPVLMPVQSIGRQGNKASMHALAKSLPGVVRKMVPSLQKEIEKTLRGMADGSIDTNEALPPELRDKLKVRVELVQATAGVTVEAPIFERFSIALSNVSRAVAVKANVSDSAAASKPSGTAGPVTDAPPEAPAADEKRAGVARIAFNADLAMVATPCAAPDGEGGVVRVYVSLPNDLCLVKWAPIHVDLQARLKVWWDTSSGMLRVAFVERPRLVYSAQLHAAATIGLPRGCTDFLVSAIVPSVLAGNDERKPLTVPLEGTPARAGRRTVQYGRTPVHLRPAVIDPWAPARPMAPRGSPRVSPRDIAAPVALKVTEVAADEEDSLAALPGLVREASRVLRGLTNPLVVDSVVPRTAFRAAKGLVIMTHVRGGVALYGGGMGSGILLRRLPTGGWSGPASMGTLAANFGVQFGWRKTDTLLVLTSDWQVDTFIQSLDGVAQIKLGATVGVAAGPVGRDAAVDARAGSGGATVCLSYSHSQGVYAGWNVEGEVLVGRKSDNEEYYYTEGVTCQEILDGEVPRPTDKDAQELYEILDGLCSEGGKGGRDAEAVIGIASAATGAVGTIADKGGEGASVVANSLGKGLTTVAARARHGAGVPLDVLGPVARASELTNAWEGTYNHDAGAFLPGFNARLLRLHLRVGDDGVLTWQMEAKYGAFFQPPGELASGVCHVHAELQAAGDERLLFDSQFARHLWRMADDGTKIIEKKDRKRSDEPEKAEPDRGFDGGTEWEREEDVEESEPQFAVAKELRLNWVGSYDRFDRMTRRTISLQLEERKDGTGVLGYRFVAKTGNLIAPAGLITSGACKRVLATPRKSASSETPRFSLEAFAKGSAPEGEERLILESRWGVHKLRLLHGGKTLVEDNSTDKTHRSVYKFTRDEEAGIAPPAAKGEVKLW